jgi:vitamin B12 transporter
MLIFFNMYFFRNAFWAFLSVGILHAQDAPPSQQLQDSIVSSTDPQLQQLDEVVVLDSRFSRKRSASGRSTVKISQEELAAFYGQELGAVLSSYAGIDLIGSRTHLGQPQTLSLRGSRSDKVLVLIDGVRVSDPSRIDSSFDINLIPLEQIERVEILKGAASTIYGNTAAAGVINIITKKETSASELRWTASTGTLNDTENTFKGLTTVSNDVRYNNRLGSLGYQLHFNQKYTDGMSAVIGTEKDPFSRRNYGLKLFKVKPQQWDWTLLLSKTDITGAYDNSFPIADAPFEKKFDQLRFSFSPKYTYAKGSVQMNIGFQDSNREFISSFPSSSEGQNTYIDVFNTHTFNSKWSLLTGVNYQREATVLEAVKHATTQTDLYTNALYAGAYFHLNTGLRWNNHSSYGSHFTYNFNPSLHFTQDSKKLRLFGSWSTAYIAPSLYQLFSPYGVTTLAPAETQTLEGGSEFISSWGSVEAVYFKRDEDPSLVFDNTTFTYANALTAVNYTGFEFRFKKPFGHHRLEFNYTYTETAGGDLRRIPKNAFTGSLDFRWSSQWTSNVQYQYLGERLAVDETTLSAFGLLDLRTFYSFKKPQLQLGISVTNALNTDYVTFKGYSSRGRNFLVSLNWKLF